MKAHLFSPRSFCLSFLLLLTADLPITAQNVTTYRYDNAITGVNSKETILTPSNVSLATFGKLFSDLIDGQAYAQPLYLANVPIPGKGSHNVVYVATCHDTVFAFDADTGGDPLWITSFTSPGKGITSVPQPDVISGDTTPEVGIVGTPVINPATGTLYLIAKTKETGRGDGHIHYVQKLHALSASTGTDKIRPFIIGDVTCDEAGSRNAKGYDYNLAANPQTPGVTGTGPNAIDGVVYFNALRTNQRPALALYNGIVYAAWASHGDNSPYNGWLIGFNAATLAPVPNSIFCLTPDDKEGGIWQSGCGPAFDNAGNLFIASGNGKFDGDKGGRNWSQSALKFNTHYGLSTAKLESGPDQTFDYFTPYNEQGLSNGDADFGSCGTMIFDVPGATPHLAVACGKEGTYYVLNRDNLGKFDPTTDHVVQKFEMGKHELVMATPVFFNNMLLYNRSGENLRARAFVNGQFSDNYNHTTTSFNGRGGGPIISANGTSNAIVWMLNNGGPASLEAYSADALTNPALGAQVPALYTGRMPDGGVKFTHPVVINGRVYCVCASRRGNVISSAHLCVFGLLASTDTTAKPAVPTHLRATSNSPESVLLSWVNHDASVTGFIIMRSPADSDTFSQIGTAGDEATTYQDNTVTAAMVYHYAVVAVNKNGNSDKSDPVTVQSHDYITENGLICYWSFDEGNGQTAQDVTGHGHTGNLTGEISWAQGIQDSQALEYHGTGNAISHVEVKDQPDLDFSASQSFSIVAWAHPASLPERWAGLVTKSRELPIGAYGIYINPANQWTFRGSLPNSDLAGGNVIPNSWQQVIAVQDGPTRTRSLYFDGALVARSESAQAADGTGPLWIGQGNASLEGFAGFIDDVRIYNRALRASDVQKLYGSYLPAVTITAPLDNSSVSSSSDILLTALVSPLPTGDTVREVNFYQGSTLLNTVRDSPYTWTWRNAPPGDYVISASVSDDNGNTTRSLPSGSK